MPQTLIARRLLTPQGTIDHPIITVEDGLIRSIESASASSDDSTLASTFFDIHTHGAANHDVMEGTPEALAAVSVGLLTIYDMCKAVDRAMIIEDIKLLEKSGGRSGHFRRAQA